MRLTLAIPILAVVSICAFLAVRKSKGENTVALRDPTSNSADAEVPSKQPSTSDIPSGLANETTPAAPRARLPDSWAALIKDFSDSERMRLEALRTRYPGAYDFKNQAQLRWMLDHGFPHPESWLIADILPDAELIRRAELGDFTAAAVAYDRWISATENLYRTTGELNRGKSPLTAYTTLLQQRLGRACAPFYGYLSARYSSVNYPSQPTSALPGYFYAAQLGDHRAAELAQQQAQAAGLDANAQAVAAMTGRLFENGLPDHCLYPPMPQ